MEAVEFIREFGWDEARVALIYCKCVPSGNLFYKNIDISISDLKRYVDAYELVQSYGGLNGAKVKRNSLHDESRFKQKLIEAIAIVEAVEK